jgi:MOSC domain-containing protein YiiM
MPKRLSRLFSWLNDWQDDELSGTLVGIFVAETAGAPMRRLERVACLPGRGLAGDRYASGQGHWQRTDGCEVTLVDRDGIRRASRCGEQDFMHGEHRRNLVVEGIPLEACRRRRLQIGEVTFEFHRLRPPCAYLDRLLRPGAAKALGKHAGIGLRVVSEGSIAVGDPVRVLVEPGSG